MNVLELDYDKILQDAYEKHKHLIICFDFDNTVYDFHNKGINYSAIVNLLQECDRLGFSLICNTSNGGDRLTFIKIYIKEVLKLIGIKHKILINETTTYDKSISSTKYTKPYANIYLDDKGGLVESYNRLNNLITKIKNNENK